MIYSYKDLLIFASNHKMISSLYKIIMYEPFFFSCFNSLIQFCTYGLSKLNYLTIHNI